MDHLKSLNEEQKRAVSKTSGPVLVIAGAGAGKTKTITERILNLIREGVSPREILAITFTNKAAREMRDRIDRAIEGDSLLNKPIHLSEKPFISTFHALGVHIIRENSRNLGLTRHFKIFDRGDSISAIKEALKNLGYDPKTLEPGKILSIISKEKGKGYEVDDFQTEYKAQSWEKIIKSVWTQYEKILKREKALDFDDLLLKALKLLKEGKDVLERYQNIWKFIHIDEYQDTNGVQYDIAKILAKKNRNIFVVGDIDQSIYSWRGADFKNIMRFEEDYPDTEVFVLEKNYRSTKKIIKAANVVISKNKLRKEKNLYTENEEGEHISLYGAFSEEDEAYFVSDTAKKLIASGVEPKNIAVLYRANFQSRVLEEAMLSEKIPYQVLGVRFFERKEIKDVISYIKAAIDMESISDLKRIINVPGRGIGKATIAKIFSGKKDELPQNTKIKVEQFEKLLIKIEEKIDNSKTSDVVNFIVVESGMKKMFEEGDSTDLERLENVAELVTLSQRYDSFEEGRGIEELLTEASLSSDQDDMKEKSNSVSLMTVHSSKGLEFDYIFITGLEEDLFPHKGLRDERKNEEEGEEERRLFYVALTRAKKKIFLSYASVRTIFGSKQINIPSEFIFDIDEDLIENVEWRNEKTRGKVIYID